MARAVPHLLGFTLPLFIAAGLRLGGAWTFLPVAVLIGALPLLDAAAGLNLLSLPSDLSDNRAFRAITWAWALAQPALLVWLLHVVSTRTLTTVEMAGLLVSVGMTTGAVGLTFGHELIHRSSALERALGEVLVATDSYTHFCIEHVYGHHRHVGTPRDPATARFGEGVWRFIPRSVFGGVASAWRIEAERLRKRGHTPWHVSNRMLRYAAVQGAMYAGAWRLFGGGAALFLAGQSMVAIVQLETINYVEHYGLERREVAPGRFERVMPWHSWNSSHRVSNWLLINLARHADHHMIASKRYQVLDHLATSPQLPAGYGSMLLLALVPPAWHRVMDSRVIAWRKEHLTT